MLKAIKEIEIIASVSKNLQSTCVKGLQMAGSSLMGTSTWLAYKIANAEPRSQVGSTTANIRSMNENSR